MRFHLVTLFEEACEAYLSASILGRARVQKKIHISYQNPRTFVDNAWGKIDERPYGGGPGMVIQALPIVRAVQRALRGTKTNTRVIIWFSPRAKQFTNKDAEVLSTYKHVVMVCGRYEGIDERAKKILKTMAPLKEFAVGEAVYTGGEIPALAIVDAVTRRLPGILGKDMSVEERRIASGSVYTRPNSISFRGKKFLVPKVLQQGNHAQIDTWRKKR